jgi:hypothetical protein
MRSRSKKESRILGDYKKNRAPEYSDQQFRENARVYHKYLSKLSRRQDKIELEDEMNEFYNDLEE